jgi:hypothetical protein
MPICPHCGSVVYVTATSCGKCGVSLTGELGDPAHVPLDPRQRFLPANRVAIVILMIVAFFTFAVLSANDESLATWGFVITALLALVVGLRES